MQKFVAYVQVILFSMLLILIAGCTDPQVDEEKDVISNHGMTVKNLGRLDAFINGSEGTQRVVHYTIEGDPLFYVLKHQDNQIKVQFDTTQDEYGTPEIFKYTCSGIEKHELDTVLEYTLTGCDGDRKEIQILQIPYDAQ